MIRTTFTKTEKYTYRKEFPDADYSVAGIWWSKNGGEEHKQVMIVTERDDYYSICLGSREDMEELILAMNEAADVTWPREEA